MTVGNHDQGPPNGTTGQTVRFNEFFGESRFLGRAYYGGHLPNLENKNDNNFELFEASGMKFVIVHLEFDDTNLNINGEALEWADSIFKAHSDRRAILVQHHLIGAGNPAAFSPKGQVAYDALKDNPNLFMMLAGHVDEEGRRVDTYLASTVHTVMADYQTRANGGDGWLRIMTFSPTNNEIRVQTYSPWLDQFEIDADSQFTLPYQMAPDPVQVITTSGSTASAFITGLSPSTLHEWSATVSDGTLSTTGPTWSITTESLAVPQPPTALNVTALSSSEIQLSWTDNSDNEDVFRLERSIDGPTGTFTPIAVVSSNLASYINTGLLPVAEYCYRVHAENGGGASADSNTACVTTPNEVPLAVDDIAFALVDFAINIPVLDNDSDPDSGPAPLSIVSVGAPTKGTAQISGSDILYTPDPLFLGTDVFTYTITDGADTATATVIVTVDVTVPGSAPGDIIISGFQATNNPNGKNPGEFIELLNTTDQVISLENMELRTLVDSNADGIVDVDWELTPLTHNLTGLTIAPHSFFLIGESGVAAPGGVIDLLTSLDLATGEGGVGERAISIELVIDNVHMDYVLYGRDDGSDPPGEIPPGDIPFSVVTGETLVAQGSTWKYLDDGSDQGTAWRDGGFDDGIWSSEAAQIRYGDGDEATVVGFGPDPQNKYITTYFRHSFDVPDVTAVANLTLDLVRDDGAVVYLNGVEGDEEQHAGRDYRLPVAGVLRSWR